MSAPASIPPDFYRGQRIGKYEVLTQISTGGMAELLLAFSEGPGGFRKYVVVKRILPDIAGDEHFVKLFLDEARLTAAFSHSNIAQVFELGEDASGLFLVMEFIPGQNLGEVAAGCAERGMPVPVGLGVGVMREVCSALHYAHTFIDPAGRPSPVIHRDVAQKNIMVGYDGSVKLLDFGVAKNQRGLSRSLPGHVKGTTGYMSPEQVRGEALDGRSDLFSVGVVLHELLSGRRLFAAETEDEEMRAILEAPIPPLRALAPHVPEPVEVVVMRALSRERSDRHANALELEQALERAAGALSFRPAQTSALVRELFSQKVEATRVLLDSAADQHQSPEFLAAVKAFKARPRPAGVTTARPAPPSAARTEKEVPAPPGPPPLSASSRSKVPTAAWLGALLVFGFGSAVLVSEVIERMEPIDGVDEPPPLEPVQLSPRPVAADGPVEKPAQEAVEPAAPPAPEPPRPAPPPSPAAARSGTLTLVTEPPAEVRRKGQVLGRSPLFKVPLPVGEQVLILVGEDGLPRRLKVPIHRDQNTALRLELDELPAISR